MEKYICELEAVLDGDLVDALDDNLGQKMEDNHKEKVRCSSHTLGIKLKFGCFS